MKSKPKTPDEGPRIEMLPIADVRPRERNPRKHPQEQIEALARSIREFGFTAPVLIESDGTLIAGHGRVEAARKAGLERVPCLRVAHLTPEQVRAYVIADNRLALDATWDEAALGAELKALADASFDLGLTGFQASEIEKITGGFDVDAASMPELASGDRQPFQQKTFTLHDEQAEEVDAAIEKAKSLGHGQSGVNENSNGNALAFVCQWFNRQDVNP